MTPDEGNLYLLACYVTARNPSAPQLSDPQTWRVLSAWGLFGARR